MSDVMDEEALRQLMSRQVAAVFADAGLVERVRAADRRRRRRLGSLGVAGTVVVAACGTTAILATRQSHPPTPLPVSTRTTTTPSADFTLSDLPAGFGDPTDFGRPPGTDPGEAIRQERYWHLPDKKSFIDVDVYSGPYTPSVLTDARAGLSGAFTKTTVRGRDGVVTRAGALVTLAWNEHPDLAVYLISSGSAGSQAELATLAADVRLADERRPVGELESTAALSIAHAASTVPAGSSALPIVFDVSFPANSRWTCATSASVRFSAAPGTRGTFDLRPAGKTRYDSRAVLASSPGSATVRIETPWLTKAARESGDASMDHQVAVELTSTDPTAAIETATADQFPEVTLVLDPTCAADG